ncbi:MAG: hypothetical protein H7067_05075 [Burkholderiales bacterium]|nr:hypothetical protein [Opitutaceae bacterium]
MANPSALNLAFAELTPHSIQVAVLSGRKIIAARAFALDAKADIAAFVTEQQISGAVRASLIGPRNFLHRSADAESGAVRQPAALQAHASKLPHGFDSAPVGVAVDAASGTAPDAARATPWLLAAVDAKAFAIARETLTTLGLEPTDLTLAVPSHIGAVASSLAAGETALVLFPGEDDAQLAWVTSDGVQAVAAAPVGFADIYEAVQRGLGLKFKAAAGKLFYNETYDFADVAPKVAEPLAAALKISLTAHPATHLHFAGLTPSQAWLSEAVAKALGLHGWATTAAALGARLGLDAGSTALTATSAGLVQLAGAASAQAAWVPTTLDNLAARPRTASPFPPKPAAASANSAPGSSVAKPQASPAVVAVSVSEGAGQSMPSPARKSNKGPILIAAGVGLVAVVVGVASHFRSPGTGPTPVPPAATTPAENKPAPAPDKPVTPAPVVPPKPAPAPVVVAPPVATVPSVDLSAAEARKFANDRYRFEVTEKGFIQALSTSRDEVLVESAAGISLQGSYVGTDGRRKWFNVGGVDDLGYQATVKKSVRDGVTVFDVKVTHPRFELEQTFVCQPNSVKVSAKFTPINLRDPRGVIAAVHSVRLSPVALNPSLRMRATADAFTYAMKSGMLGVSFENAVWARDGADGRQTIIAGENGVAFHFTETTEAARNSLNYEISVP